MPSRNLIVGVAICTVLLFATTGFTAPLGVNIIDHDFTFDVPYSNPAGAGPVSAVYNFNGTGADTLGLSAFAGGHSVHGYTYAGLLQQEPIALANGVMPSIDPYPLIHSLQFGAKLEIELSFDASDGPYVSPSDRFDISLTGDSGYLRIFGQVASQMWGGPILHDPSGDTLLLEIAFTRTSLLARVNEDIADIEAAGKITHFMGADEADLAQLPELQLGSSFFRFMLPDVDGVIFHDPNYKPEDDVQGLVFGRISGEAGVSTPEPATMTLFALGSLAVCIRRRRKA